jgi:DNA end-binding protein Ku
MARGYEFSRGRYVVFSDEELESLGEKATHGIEIAEFVPAESVDPVHYEKTYHLGPDKGGEKAYALLAAAMEDTGLLAVAKHAARGKDYLVLLKPRNGRLEMIQLYHSDEVRPVSEVPFEKRPVRETELALARKLIGQVASERFEPRRYEDEVRKRVRALIAKKVKGEDITEAAAPGEPRAKVVDLMEALKASLERKGGSRETKPSGRRRSPAPGRARAHSTRARASRAARTARDRKAS